MVTCGVNRLKIRKTCGIGRMADKRDRIQVDITSIRKRIEHLIAVDPIYRGRKLGAAIRLLAESALEWRLGGEGTPTSIVSSSTDSSRLIEFLNQEQPFRDLELLQLARDTNISVERLQVIQKCIQNHAEEESHVHDT